MARRVQGDKDDQASIAASRNQQDLWNAATDGDLQKMRRAIDRGAQVDVPRPPSGWTALICAAQNGHTEMVETLVTLKANLEIKDDEGHTALMFAARGNHTSTVTSLIRNRANIHARNNAGGTALFCAALNNHYEPVIALINAGADTEARDQRGNSALDVVRLRCNNDLIYHNLVTALEKAQKMRSPETDDMMALSSKTDQQLKELCAECGLNCGRKGRIQTIEMLHDYLRGHPSFAQMLQAKASMTGKVCTPYAAVQPELAGHPAGYLDQRKDGLRRFPQVPTQKSMVDELVFGHDIDGSGVQKSHKEYRAMFADSFGKPSAIPQMR
eukprot:TRINITY_DN37403_c0_g1_i1.p1 TRINITY_DN37403_c0_g1~~TRINITY_DN37403_c0_g1_i1.p1  ORF type:complete len:351 (+),score=47.33 TRINITY_DN37403_c0_g1_i1:72-1055(+)